MRVVLWCSLAAEEERQTVALRDENPAPAQARKVQEEVEDTKREEPVSDQSSRGGGGGPCGAGLTFARDWTLFVDVHWFCLVLRRAAFKCSYSLYALRPSKRCSYRLRECPGDSGNRRICHYLPCASTHRLSCLLSASVSWAH